MRGILGEKPLDFSPPPRLLLDLPWSLLSSSYELGGSSCGDDFVGAIFSPEAVLFLQAMGISFEGNTMRFLNPLAQVDQGMRHEVPNPIPPSPKLIGSRELKNLECSINFDARSHGSSQGKSKKALVVM
jgi:hypothetical protein